MLPSAAKITRAFEQVIDMWSPRDRRARQSCQRLMLNALSVIDVNADRIARGAKIMGRASIVVPAVASAAGANAAQDASSTAPATINSAEGGTETLAPETLRESLAVAVPILPVAPEVVKKDEPAVPKGRSDENVVRQAQDAFGTTIDRETIGIYSSSSMRGFSPIAAGNVRIDGLYFDQVGALNSRIQRSTSIGVGLLVQTLDCPR